MENQRFIVLNPKGNSSTGKRPAELNWTKDRNYSYEDMIKKDVQKYGVLCGFNNLIVVDCDTKEFQDKFLEESKFADTFRVKTAGKGLLHFYLYVNENDDPATRRINKFTEIGTQRVADIQGLGTQVVGGNSEIDGKFYTIENDVPIKTVSYTELLAFCETLIPKTEIQQPFEKKRATGEIIEFEKEIDPVISYIKSKLTVRDILEEKGINTRLGTNCECPLGHTSESGKCFSYQDHQWHCFHCEKHGSMFDLVMEIYNMSFIEAKNMLAEKVGVPEKMQKESKQMIMMKKRAEATELLVKKFCDDNHIYTVKNDLKPEIWIYNNGIYQPHGKFTINTFCRAALGKYYSTHISNQVIAKIMAQTGIDEEEFFGKIYQDLVPVKNGILDISTKKLYPFDPHKIFFNKFPVSYDPDVESPKEFLKFIDSTLADEKEIKSVQEMFGYSLTTDCRLKKGFMLYGKGDNGKSVLLDVLISMVGGENASHIDLRDFDEDKFAMFGLFGKVVNINPDIKKGTLNETGKLKNLIAGDKVDAARKFLTTISFRNRAKMIFGANNLPDVGDDSDGFFTRWVIIEFPYSFKRPTDFDYLNDEEKASGKYKLADMNLTEKLTTEKELTGILNWSLEGLHRLLNNKQFSKNEPTTIMRCKWYKKASSMKAFLSDKIEITQSPEDFILATDLRVEYVKYCQENGLKIQMQKECTIILDENLLVYKNKKFASGTGSFEYRKVWEGLKIK